MANEVSAWLANPKRSYSEGVSIYKKYKNKPVFIKFFESGTDPAPGSAKFNMLIDKISRINRILLLKPQNVKAEESKANPIVVRSIDVTAITKQVKAENNQAEAQRPKVVDNPLVDVKELPDELKVKYFENKELTRLLNKKHDELKKLGNDKAKNNDRKQLAKQIVDLDDTRAANWKAIDTWWQENKAKSKKEEKPDESKGGDPVDVTNKINNLRNYIRRSQAESKRNPKRKEANDKKIANWKKQLHELTGGKD